MAKNPKPIEVGGARASVVRGPKDGRWYWRARRKGQRDTVWTGWATREEAQVALAAVVSRGLPSPRASSVADSVRTVGDLLDAWIDAQEQRVAAGDLAPRSLQNYRQHAGYWKAELEDVLPSAVDRARVHDTLMGWAADGGALRTCSVSAKVIGAAFRWGAERGMCRALDTRGVGPTVHADEHVNNSRTPTPAEFATALAHVGHEDVRSAIQLIGITGARAGEIAALRVGDYDRAARTLVLSGRDESRRRRGKTGRRTFPLPGAGVELLDDLVGERGPDEPLLPGLWKDAAAAIRYHLLLACEAAEVPRFTAHGIRRMVVHRMLERGVDPKTASTLTGHSVQTMLTAYMRPSEDDLRRAVTKAGLGRIGKTGEVIELPKRAQNSVTISEE